KSSARGAGAFAHRHFNASVQPLGALLEEGFLCLSANRSTAATAKPSKLSSRYFSENSLPRAATPRARKAPRSAFVTASFTPATCASWRSRFCPERVAASLFVKHVDKAALLDPAHDRRVDDRRRVGLPGLRIFEREDIQAAFDHRQRRHRRRLQLGECRRVGLFENFVPGAAQISAPDGDALLFVGAKNSNAFDQSFQHSLD